MFLQFSLGLGYGISNQRAQRERERERVILVKQMTTMKIHAITVNANERATVKRKICERMDENYECHIRTKSQCQKHVHQSTLEKFFSPLSLILSCRSSLTEFFYICSSHTLYVEQI